MYQDKQQYFPLSLMQGEFFLVPISFDPKTNTEDFFGMGECAEFWLKYPFPLSLFCLFWCGSTSLTRTCHVIRVHVICVALAYTGSRGSSKRAAPKNIDTTLFYLIC